MIKKNFKPRQFNVLGSIFNSITRILSLSNILTLMLSRKERIVQKNVLKS